MNAPDAQVRQPLLKGRRTVAGLWLPADWLDVEERTALLLHHWHADARAWRFAEGDLLRFASARPMDCDGLVGWPLLALKGGGLCSAELEAEERAMLPVADLWLVRGSQVQALRLADAQDLALEEHIALGGYPLLDTCDCRAALPPPVLEVLPPIKDIHAILDGKVKPPSPERDNLIKALAQQQAGAQRPTPSRPSPRKWRINASWAFWLSLFVIMMVGNLIRDAMKQPTNIPPPTLSSVPAAAPTLAAPSDDSDTVLFVILITIAVLIAMLLFAALRRFFKNGQHGWTAQPSAPSQIPVKPPAAPPIKPRAAQAPSGPGTWRRFLTALAITSKFSELLNRRQSAYMRRMLKMFEDGDIAEALRHALPLGGEQGDLRQAFGTPTRRDDLDLGKRSGPGTAISLGEDLEAHLRKVYRQHFEKLDREGRIDEAVFILAELLKARQEALDYLERHQRFRQAADLALAWDMPADCIVRLHCLAGDWRTALQIARRDDAFANAVEMLGKKWPQVAQRLREDWAEMLVARGEWLEAVDAIWPLPDKQEQAAQWLLCAEDAGGGLGAEALVKRAVLLPDTLDAYATRLKSLRDDPTRAGERFALAQALNRAGTLPRARNNEQLQLLARLVLPPLLEDHARGRVNLSRRDLQELLNVSRDKLLLADLPPKGLPQREGQPLLQRASPLQWQAPQAGQRAILDAAPLAEGRTLVALGEAGLAVLDDLGRPLFRFAEPGHRIVLARNQRVALALARRDQLWRITKLDLVSRKATDLGVLAMDFHASEFDGTSWTIGDSRSVRVVDVDRAFAVVWHVSELPGPIRAFQGRSEIEQWLVENAHGDVELWRYTLPTRRLTHRYEVHPSTKEQGLFLLNPYGGLLEIEFRSNEVGEQILLMQTREVLLPGIKAEQISKLKLKLFDGWLLIGAPGDAGMTRWRLISQRNTKVCAELDWPSDTPLQSRSLEHDWRLFDQTGRLLRLDTLTSELRELRG